MRKFDKRNRKNSGMITFCNLSLLTQKTNENMNKTEAQKWINNVSLFDRVSKYEITMLSCMWCAKVLENEISEQQAYECRSEERKEDNMKPEIRRVFLYLF